MRLADFYDFVNHEFGPQHGPWLLHSHVLMNYGRTPAELIEDGIEPRDIWWALCKEHDVPEDRWYGPDE